MFGVECSMFSPQFSRVIPCVLFEDEHLLVVDKPAGVNTHAPSPFAGEGIYDWLRHREPRWATLAIIHRLDKETSGVMVFGKTPLANRSLTEQFTAREVHKKYLLLTDRPVKQREFTVKSSLLRVGEKYASRAGGESAETLFRVLESRGGRTLVEAEPRTGRTHQIRVHAAESGFPILGDVLYGAPVAERLFLHAAELSFQHPEKGARCEFKSTIAFAFPSPSPRPSPHGRGRIVSSAELESARPVLPMRGENTLSLPEGEGWGEGEGGSVSTELLKRRLALIDPAETNAYRLIHGTADGWPGWYVERLGDFLLSQAERPLTTAQQTALAGLLEQTRTRGAYHKILNRDVRRTVATDASPQLVLGEAAPERFTIRENGVTFELSFTEGYSVGLFLDQRDNRRRFLSGHIATRFPLTRPAEPTPIPSKEASRKPQAFANEAPLRGEVRGGLSQCPLEILNCFAYTCGFSVCAAKAGARVTSLDLSKKYLDWGRRNFTLNGLDPAQHDFIFGDTFDWLKRLAKKGRAFDVIVLDPPTFSQSKESGVFRAEKDYEKLASAALAVLKPNGILLASTNAADWPPENFVATVKAAVSGAKRRVTREHFVPQPLDFPVTRNEPGYLKTLWLNVA